MKVLLEDGPLPKFSRKDVWRLGVDEKPVMPELFLAFDDDRTVATFVEALEGPVVLRSRGARGQAVLVVVDELIFGVGHVVAVGQVVSKKLRVKKYLLAANETSVGNLDKRFGFEVVTVVGAVHFVLALDVILQHFRTLNDRVTNLAGKLRPIPKNFFAKTDSGIFRQPRL